MPRLHFFRIRVFTQGFQGVLFTGKLVKTIIINKLPEYADLFKPSKGDVPKLVHVSPLFKTSGGRVRCVYSYVPCKRGDLAKCEGKPVLIKLNGVYDFYVGFTDNALDYDKFISAMTSLDECFTFMDQRVCTSVLELEYTDPFRAVAEIARRTLSEGRVKITFASPTMLRDPFRSTKHKSLIPTVFNIFSTPLYIKLYTTGTYTLRRFRSQLLILHRLFSEPYTTLSNVKLRWVVYGRRPEPTIIGYTNLYVNQEYLDQYKRYINLEEYLTEVYAHMIALGIGVGRATGFGHVLLGATGS